MLKPNEPGHNALLQKVLERHGLAVPEDRIVFSALPKNLTRKDWGTRDIYLAQSTNRVLCSITIGQALQNLYTRAKNFAETFPEYASAPLFIETVEGYDVLALVFERGEPLINALNGKEDRRAKAVASLEKLKYVFEAKILPSNAVELRNEVDQKTHAIEKLSYISPVDLNLIKGVIVPTILSQITFKDPKCRIIHGDLTASNILIDPEDRLRLIDFEFSEVSHFPNNEWMRLKLFSGLESGAAQALEPHWPKISPGEAAFFWLNQILLENQTNHSPEKQIASRIAELARLIESNPDSFGKSHFINSTTEFSRPQWELLQSFTGFAQLFWTESGTSFTERNSKLQLLKQKSDGRHTLSFIVAPGAIKKQISFRFDPVAQPGIVRIFRVGIFVGQTSRTKLWNAEKLEDFKTSKVGGTVLLLPDETNEYTLFSFGKDPRVEFPPLTIPNEGASLTVEIEYGFTESLSPIADTIRDLIQISPEPKEVFQKWPALLRGVSGVLQVQKTEPALRVLKEIEGFQKSKLELDGKIQEFMKAGAEQNSSLRATLTELSSEAKKSFERIFEAQEVTASSLTDVKESWETSAQTGRENTDETLHSISNLRAVFESELQNLKRRIEEADTRVEAASRQSGESLKSGFAVNAQEISRFRAELGAQMLHFNSLEKTLREIGNAISGGAKNVQTGFGNIAEKLAASDRKLGTIHSGIESVSASLAIASGALEAKISSSKESVLALSQEIAAWQAADNVAHKALTELNQETLRRQDLVSTQLEKVDERERFISEQIKAVLGQLELLTLELSKNREALDLARDKEKALAEEITNLREWNLRLTASASRAELSETKTATEHEALIEAVLETLRIYPGTTQGTEQPTLSEKRLPHLLREIGRHRELILSLQEKLRLTESHVESLKTSLRESERDFSIVSSSLRGRLRKRISKILK